MPVIDSYSGADTLVAGAGVAAPGAGATIASLTIPVSGIYQLEINVSLTATTETALNNVRVAWTRPEGTASTNVLPSITGPSWDFVIPRARIGGGTSVIVNAIAAATAGSVYAAVITATRVG